MERYSDDPPEFEKPVSYSIDYPPAVEIIEVKPRDKLEELCIEGLKAAVKANKAHPKRKGMTPEKAHDYAYNWFGVDIDFEDKPVIIEEQVVIEGLETTIQLEKRRIDETLISDDEALD